MTRKVFTRSLAAFAFFTVVCGVVYTLADATHTAA